MGFEKEDPSKCDHSWRRPKKRELEPHDNPRHHIVCRACNVIKQVPFDLLEHYDIYFPSFPEDED